MTNIHEYKKFINQIQDFYPQGYFCGNNLFLKDFTEWQNNRVVTYDFEEIFLFILISVLYSIPGYIIRKKHPYIQEDGSILGVFLSNQIEYRFEVNQNLDWIIEIRDTKYRQNIKRFNNLADLKKSSEEIILKHQKITLENTFSLRI